MDKSTQTTPDIEKCLRIIELYFAPWGAAKAAEWEDLLGDRFFGPETALKEIYKILGGSFDIQIGSEKYCLEHAQHRAELERQTNVGLN